MTSKVDTGKNYTILIIIIEIIFNITQNTIIETESFF